AGRLCNELALDRERRRATVRAARAGGRSRGLLAQACRFGEMTRACRRGFGVVGILVAGGGEWRGRLTVVDVLAFLLKFAAPAPGRGLPAGRGLPRAHRSQGAEAGAVVAVGRNPAEAALRLRHLDV